MTNLYGTLVMIQKTFIAHNPLEFTMKLRGMKSTQEYKNAGRRLLLVGETNFNKGYMEEMAKCANFWVAKVLILQK